MEDIDNFVFNWHLDENFVKLMGFIKDDYTAHLYFVAFDSLNLFGGTGLIWTISISPYQSRLGKLLNALCCLLLVTTQEVCKFTSAGGGRVFEICLRTIESCNQLGNCCIWDIAI